MKSTIRHILLADDDPDDQEMFLSGIRRQFPDIRVTVANDCEQLLERLKAFSIDEMPDCIVIDYHMPKSNGPECLKATNTSTPYGQIPKIVWSTSRRVQDAQECLALGASRFVTKPDSMAQLETFVKSLESTLH